MSVRVMSDVWEHSQASGNALLVLLAMADEAHESGDLTNYRRSKSHFAKKCNCSPGSVTRALAELVKLGEIKITKVGTGREQSDYQILVGRPIEGVQSDTPQPDVEGIQDDTPGRATVMPQGAHSDAPGRATVMPPSSRSSPVLPGMPNPTAPPPAPERPERLIARTVWEAKDPRPVTPFIAIQKLAAKFLEAGWTSDQIIAGMIAAPTISTGAVELQLNRSGGRLSSVRPPAQIDNDREGPTGLVEGF